MSFYPRLNESAPTSPDFRTIINRLASAWPSKYGLPKTKANRIKGLKTEVDIKTLMNDIKIVANAKNLKVTNFTVLPPRIKGENNGNDSHTFEAEQFKLDNKLFHIILVPFIETKSSTILKEILPLFFFKTTLSLEEYSVIALRL